jgi:predicted PurR-regulated permease PerM
MRQALPNVSNIQKTRDAPKIRDSAHSIVNFLHILVPIAFALIIASMISALYFMMHDRGRTKRMVWSLATRVGFSISLFLFILFAHWMGWIQPTGIPIGR